MLILESSLSPPPPLEQDCDGGRPAVLGGSHDLCPDISRIIEKCRGSNIDLLRSGLHSSLRGRYHFVDRVSLFHTHTHARAYARARRHAEKPSLSIQIKFLAR